MAVWRIAPGGRGLGMGRLFEACLHLCELAKTSTDWNAFGDLSSERVFGHSGASGTVAWADPQRELVCVILTTRPWRQDKGFFFGVLVMSFRGRSSNQLAQDLPSRYDGGKYPLIQGIHSPVFPSRRRKKEQRFRGSQLQEAHS